MTFQTDAPLVHRSLSASNRSAREIARQAFEGDLDLFAPYQRPNVWGLTSQMNLVRSWCLGIPVPAVYLNDRGTHAWKIANDGRSPLDHGEAYYAVVDGKQRISTAVGWFFGDLAVPASWFPAESIETTVDTDDGPYVTYAGLSLVAQRHFSNRAMLPTIEANATTVAEEADLYLLVNTSGTAQSEDDLAHAATFSSEM